MTGKDHWDNKVNTDNGTTKAHHAAKLGTLYKNSIQYFTIMQLN